MSPYSDFFGIETHVDKKYDTPFLKKDFGRT